ncbi:hypothetical protein BUALT_Bualt02G0248200 [Buddleja alternifolia]|uniref:DUF4283 domain-containing protein n=1 Tax=Buddleja alternifolia TaxID=168488 RepID=A0AAV6Y959_9LAMI|nr:hypothetical protein BUALT_Bualt02G0248200 [Buddleja alternifolia]
MEPPPAADQHDPSVSNPTITTKKTYADKFKETSIPQAMADREAKKAFVQGIDSKVIGTASVINGRKTIFLSKEEDDFMAAPYQYSLVGKFSHGYPTMTRLRAKFAALGLKQGFKIGVLDHKHVWIRLFDPNDYARVWMKQTWYFDGFPMRVLKWMSEFDPKEESPIMPIWIKVFGLRPHWSHRQFLYHVASLIGKPLKLDEATTEIENTCVARMCVELNVLEKLQKEIPIQINGKTQFCKVQYEGIPEYCRICRHRGHSMAACYVNNEKQENGATRNQTEQETEKGEELRALLDKKRGKKPIDSQQVPGEINNIVSDLGLNVNVVGPSHTNLNAVDKHGSGKFFADVSQTANTQIRILKRNSQEFPKNTQESHEGDRVEGIPDDQVLLITDGKNTNHDDNFDKVSQGLLDTERDSSEEEDEHSASLDDECN